MNDLVYNTMNISTDPRTRLKAVKLYCEGVKSDFPETATWMNNIMLLAGFDFNTGEPFIS